MVYTHVLKTGPLGVLSPAERIPASETNEINPPVAAVSQRGTAPSERVGVIYHHVNQKRLSRTARRFRKAMGLLLLCFVSR